MIPGLGGGPGALIKNILGINLPGLDALGGDAQQAMQPVVNELKKFDDLIERATGQNPQLAEAAQLHAMQGAQRLGAMMTGMGSNLAPAMQQQLAGQALGQMFGLANNNGGAPALSNNPAAFNPLGNNMTQQPPLRNQDGTGGQLSGAGGGGMSFEKMLAMAMLDAAKKQEQKIKGMIDKLKSMDQEGGGGGGGGGMLGSIGSIAGGMFGGPVGSAIGGAVGGALGGGGGGGGGAGEQSRATLMEEMKFEVQQYTQMMSAISNVLNTMHERAMETSRAIGK